MVFLKQPVSIPMRNDSLYSKDTPPQHPHLLFEVNASFGLYLLKGKQEIRKTLLG